MKKLLAIAVVAAMTVPAMADTSVYGKAHVSLNKASGTSMDLQSHSSRIGLKGSNALDNGLTATHKFEMGINLTDNSCSTPEAAAAAVPGADACVKDSGLTDRDAWVGLKGGFGEVRFGRHTLPSDMLDDHTDFMTNGAALNQVEGRQNNVMAYIGAFGPVTVGLAHIADGTRTGIDKANDIAIAYKAGPIEASLGHTAPDNGDKTSGVGLSYTGANYGVGFKHDKKGSSKQNTLSGMYSFGKAYVAAEYGKVSGGGPKSQIVELGYGLGKGTKVYFENSKQTPAIGSAAKNNRIGLEHSF